MAEKLKNILYIALARRADSVPVASFGKSAHVETVTKLLSSPAFSNKATPGKNIRLINNGTAIFLLSNQDNLAAIVVTADDYAERTVFGGLIPDVFEKFSKKNYKWQNCEANSLSKKFKSELKSICTQYDDPTAHNKIAKLRGQVSQVQSVMQDNISKALDNLESTENLKEKAEDLVDAAGEFERKSKKLAWREWCMLQKMRFMIFMVFVVIIIIIIVAICGDGKTCAGPEETTGTSPTASRRVLENTNMEYITSTF